MQQGRALLVVDVQRDFCSGGALPVAGGQRVAAAIRRLIGSRSLRQQPGDYRLVVGSRDWHHPETDNGGHFSDWPDFSSSWPPHCLADTFGAEYAPPLAAEHMDIHIFKGWDEPAYSAFSGYAALSPKPVLCPPPEAKLSRVLRDRGIAAVDVVGLATDHCVFHSARDAVAAGFRVRLLPELCAAVNPEKERRCLLELARLGVQLGDYSGTS